MELMARCGRCGALVKARGRRLYDGTVAYYTPCAAVTEASSNDMVARHACEFTVLCPDCIGQLKAWLAGGQTKDLSIAGDIIRDMYAALGAKPRRQQACEYLSGRDPVTCARCAEDPAQCVDEMFKEIRCRCAEIGIDLKEEADAKR